ncbi:MAG: hypothetical protein ABR881_29940 [Candidatus Sulfotelmatobacter sp.]
MPPGKARLPMMRDPSTTSCVAQANRELVADQFVATTRENGWTAGEACPHYWLLLAESPSDEAAVWGYGAADRGATCGKQVEDASKVRMIVNRV